MIQGLQRCSQERKRKHEKRVYPASSGSRRTRGRGTTASNRLARSPTLNNKLTHNQENRFQTGLTLAQTLRTAVIHASTIQGFCWLSYESSKRYPNRQKCWSSLFADILLHHALNYKCDDRTRSVVPVGTLKRKLQSLRYLRTTLRFFPIS